MELFAGLSWCDLLSACTLGMILKLNYTAGQVLSAVLSSVPNGTGICHTITAFKLSSLHHLLTAISVSPLVLDSVSASWQLPCWVVSVVLGQSLMCCSTVAGKNSDRAFIIINCKCLKVRGRPKETSRPALGEGMWENDPR